MNLHKILLPLFCFFVFLFDSSYLHAQEFENTSSYIYELLDNGDMQVTQNLQITNLSNSLFASSYKLNINNIDIYDIEAQDGKTALTTNIRKEGENTVIDINLKNHVIGEGRIASITLKYKTKHLSSKNGNLIEVNIPKTTSGNIKGVTLKTPKYLGSPNYISPKPFEENSDDNFLTYKFSGEDFKRELISLTFGDVQIFNFKVTYELINNSLLPQKKFIALLPDINDRQEIKIKQISKAPESIERDQDSNYLAQYTLKPKEKLSVDLIGTAKIQNKKINISEGGDFNDIPRDISKNYTKSQRYWESNNGTISQIAKQHFSSKESISFNAYEAYKYVTEVLKYNNKKVDNKTVSRMGAIKALENPGDAICMEFVDLFIAITRSMGIPSREINGYAFSKSSDNPLSINLRGGDVLHSWAEYYDPNFGWVPIDPTWGATSGQDHFTKLDSNHIAFVVKGINSEYPLPAGAYKFPENNKPLIDVSFSSSEEFEGERIEMFFKDEINKKTQQFNFFSFFPVLITLLLGLLLYGILYSLIARPHSRKK